MSADAKVQALALTRDLELSDEARGLLLHDHSPGQFLGVLSAHRLYEDGIHLLSRWLPSREAVWWGCTCVWHLHRTDPLAKVEEDAVRASVQWVVDPSEKHRRAAEAAADAAEMTTAAGCMAYAVFFSGGSISGPDLPAVAPAPHMAATVLAQGLIMATAGITASDQHRQRFLQLGYQVATGGDHWEQHLKKLAAASAK
jgi:hypothetical protein